MTLANGQNPRKRCGSDKVNWGKEGKCPSAECHVFGAHGCKQQANEDAIWRCRDAGVGTARDANVGESNYQSQREAMTDQMLSRLQI